MGLPVEQAVFFPVLYFYTRLYHAAPDQTLDQVLTRALHVLEQAGIPAPRLRFLLEDASAVALAVQRHPELAPYQTGNALSNFDALWDVCNPRTAGSQPALPLLVEVCRSFPFASASVVLGPLPWSGHPPPVEALRQGARFSARFPITTYLASSVLVQRLTSGGLRLAAIAQLTAPQQSPPEVFDALGPTATDQLVEVSDTAVPAPPPSTPQEVQQRYRSNLRRILEQLPLPHDLPPLREILLSPAREPLGQVKPVLVAAFAPLGWRPSPGVRGKGANQLTKRTPHGRTVLLDFDVAPWDHTITCLLTLVTERGAFRLPVPPSLEVEAMQYPVFTKELFGKVIDNLCAVVAGLEATWRHDLEQSL